MLHLRTRVAGSVPYRPWRAAVQGGLMGLLFPLAAVLLDQMTLTPRPSLAEVWSLRRLDPTFWVVSLTPLLLAAASAWVEHWRYQQRLASREHGFLRALIGAVDGIVLLSGEDGRVLHANQSAYRIMELGPEEVLGHSLREFVQMPEEGGRVEQGPDLVQRWLGNPGHFPVRLECVLTAGEGNRRIAWSITRLPSEPLEEPLYLCTGIDITERHDLQERLAHQAHHDALTSLVNRARFHQKIKAALAEQESIGILFIDLDGFKLVNDTLGHAAGDELLRNVGRRILNAVRGSDTAARLGGDEFAVLLEGLPSAEDAELVARRILTSLQKPFQLTSQDIRISGSIGIAHSVPGDSADQVLSHADLAMYMAKGAGKGRCVVYDPASHLRLMEVRRLESEIESAIEQGQFIIHYQPIVNLATGAPVAVEALARWAHPERGLLSPGEFIPSAEETGAIIRLGCWLLRESCRQVLQWRAGGVPELQDLRLSVNISARQIHDPAFFADLLMILEEEDFRPEHLIVEITESMLLHNAEHVNESLKGLHAIGVQVALDDFGTGHSSLFYLQRFPVNLLKLDRSFVRSVGVGDPSSRLTEALVSLGQALDLSIVAEGIETEEQRSTLLRLGCELGQGYLFGLPLDPQEFAGQVGQPRSPLPFPLGHATPE